MLDASNYTAVISLYALFCIPKPWEIGYLCLNCLHSLEVSNVAGCFCFLFPRPSNVYTLKSSPISWKSLAYRRRRRLCLYYLPSLVTDTNSLLLVYMWYLPTISLSAFIFYLVKNFFEDKVWFTSSNVFEKGSGKNVHHFALLQNCYAYL